MIHIYFVRHGETVANVARRLQPHDTRLSERGRAQAQAVGQTLSALRPTHLITSTQVRAVETTRAITESLSLTPETSSLFEELRRPDHVNGHFYRSGRTLWYLLRWYLDQRFHDNTPEVGETYAMFRRRLREAKEYLAQYPEGSRLVVVSHSIFITLFLAHRCEERRLPPWRAIYWFFRIFRFKNTGLVHLEYAPELVNRECPWRIVKGE